MSDYSYSSFPYQELLVYVTEHVAMYAINYELRTFMKAHGTGIPNNSNA